MFCIYCGAPNPENACFCSACGRAIGAAADPVPVAEAAPPSPGSAEKSLGNATGQGAPPVTPAVVPPATLHAEPQPMPQATAQAVPQPTLQPMPQAQYPSAPAGKGKPILWVLAGFAACLLIVIAVAMGLRLNQASSGTEAARENAVSETAPAAAPAAYTAPTAAPAADPTAPAADTTSAPVSAPVQPLPSPAPAAPQNPIVGDWKATTVIGSTIGLHLGADGRYILNPGSDEGVYSYSSGDGTLRLQSNSFFSSGVMVWSCQVSGDTLSCVDPNGAGHVYNRVR